MVDPWLIFFSSPSFSNCAQQTDGHPLRDVGITSLKAKERKAVAAKPLTNVIEI